MILGSERPCGTGATRCAGSIRFRSFRSICSSFRSVRCLRRRADEIGGRYCEDCHVAEAQDRGAKVELWVRAGTLRLSELQDPDAARGNFLKAAAAASTFSPATDASVSCLWPIFPRVFTRHGTG